MKAVWSFWSTPFFASRRHTWASEKHHLLSWILSFQTARKHFRKTALFTDEPGARMLVDGLGLEFDTISTELNALEEHDPKWWALGKIYTYRLQTEPFIHIDSDAFLWKPLPVSAETDLFAQNPEGFVIGASYYMPEHFEAVIRSVPGGWLPVEWEWYRSSGHTQRAEWCGIFGGSQMDFIQYYADLAIQLVEYPANQKAWPGLSDQIERNILVEQYLLSACIEYHKNHSDSEYRNIGIQYLFNSLDDAFNPQKAAEVGYTHLVANAKHNQEIADKLERRVKKDYPEDYERCIRYLQNCSITEQYSAHPMQI